jgi:dTDP-glucose pyrophosphorylase/CBS domain-containing protein
MFQHLDKVKLSLDAKIKTAIERLQSNYKQLGVGVIIIVSPDDYLEGIITDFDIRNAILNNLKAEDTISKWLEIKRSEGWRTSPIKILHTASTAEIIDTLNKHSLTYLPVVDENNKLIDLITNTSSHSDVQAVVMAGGFGKRLMPLTEENPKPMLHVGGIPLLERSISHLSKYDIKDLVISLHYKPEKITDYFGNGNKFGVNINYTKEDFPLGTAGALKLIKKNESKHLIVTNGDIFTDIDYASMINFHKNMDADITIGLIQESIKIPYGIINTNGSTVISIEEKPDFKFTANAGIYIIKREVIDHIPAEKKYDMTELIEDFIAQKKNVVGYPIIEEWIDIGNLEQYHKANSKASKTE